MSKFSQWIAVAFSSWYTWLIYAANTPAGTEAQADLVSWIAHLFLLVALSMFSLKDSFLVHLSPKNHVLKAGGDINILLQVFLLVVTNHWWLAFVRAAAEILAKYLVSEARKNEMIVNCGATLGRNYDRS